MKKQLEEATDEELNAEIQRRKDVAESNRLQEHQEHVRLVYENVDSLLKLAKHSRSTCSDKYYDTDRCVRCALLQLKDSGLFPYTVVLDLSRTLWF